MTNSNSPDDFGLDGIGEAVLRELEAEQDIRDDVIRNWPERIVDLNAVDAEVKRRMASR